MTTRSARIGSAGVPIDGSGQSMIAYADRLTTLADELERMIQRGSEPPPVDDGDTDPLGVSFDVSG